MDLPQYRMRFKTWLLGRLATVGPRRNQLQSKETMDLKTRGLSSRGVGVLAAKTR